MWNILENKLDTARETVKWYLSRASVVHQQEYFFIVIAFAHPIYGDTKSRVVIREISRLDARK